MLCDAAFHQTSLYLARQHLKNMNRDKCNMTKPKKRKARKVLVMQLSGLIYLDGTRHSIPFSPLYDKQTKAELLSDEVQPFESAWLSCLLCIYGLRNLRPLIFVCPTLLRFSRSCFIFICLSNQIRLHCAATVGFELPISSFLPFGLLCSWDCSEQSHAQPELTQVDPDYFFFFSFFLISHGSFPCFVFLKINYLRKICLFLCI